MLTKGRNRAEMRHRMVVGEVRVAGRGRARGGGRNRGAPCRLIHQGGPCGPCGGVQGVSVGEGSPAVYNRSESSSPVAAVSGEFPARGSLRSISRSLVRF